MSPLYGKEFAGAVGVDTQDGYVVEIRYRAGYQSMYGYQGQMEDLTIFIPRAKARYGWQPTLKTFVIERGQREASINTLYPIVQALDGDFTSTLHLLAIDAGVPEEAMAQKSC